jgi:hypothetical protein
MFSRRVILSGVAGFAAAAPLRDARAALYPEHPITLDCAIRARWID